MKKNIKQALSLLLVAAMLVACVPAAMAAEDQTSGTVPVTITASAPTFSVTVPTTLPIHMDAYGDVTCGDITIINNSAGPVRVKDTQLTALNGWTLVDYASTNFAQANAGQHKLALQLGDWEDAIAANGGQKSIDVAAKIPYQGARGTQADIAQVVFVLEWHRAAVALTGLSITGDDSVDVGSSIQLTAVKSPANTTDTEAITWSSSDPSVATVSSSGRVIGKDIGEAVITASCNGMTATHTVTLTWTPTRDDYSIILEGPTQANCTGGKWAPCRLAYGKLYTGAFAGFNSASGEHYIDFMSQAGIPNSAVESAYVAGKEFSLINGRWTYSGYLPGGSDISITFTLK